MTATLTDEKTYCGWSDMLVRECAHCRGHVAEDDTKEIDALGRVATALGVSRAEMERRIPKPSDDEDEGAV